MLTFLLSSLFASMYPDSTPIALPTWIQTRWTQAELGKTFSFAAYAKPSFLRADFNGDDKPDVAILITRRATGSRGILILHQGLAAYYVLGTGIPTHCDILRGSFSWADHWNLYTRPTTQENRFTTSGDLLESRTVRLKRPTIEVTRMEQGGGMIYWNGKRYIWIHQTC